MAPDDDLASDDGLASGDDLASDDDFASGDELKAVSGRDVSSAPEEDVPSDPLLRPAEVAALFRVNPKTVARWARDGKLNAQRTLGGHRRFRASEIYRFLKEMSAQPR